MVCTHNCVNDFLKDTGVAVESVAINLIPVRPMGEPHPSTLLVDVKVYLEDL